jgi:hypothetical protein
MRTAACLLLVLIIGCKSKPKEPSQEDRIQQIAAPLIANDVADLNIAARAYFNKKLDESTRGDALGILFKRFPEYMVKAPDYVNDSASYFFQVERQRKLIEEKYFNYASQIIYKQDLQKQYEHK